MVRPPQPTHRGGAGTLCVHVVSLCADTKTMTCRPCLDTHIHTYKQTINQYKQIVIIHKSIETYSYTYTWLQMVRPPQPTHTGGAGTLCVHVVSLCADTKTMTCRPCWDTHILTYQQTDRQTHRHTYINQYKDIVIPIHGCICVTYPPFGGGGGGEPGGAGSYIYIYVCVCLMFDNDSKCLHCCPCVWNTSVHSRLLIKCSRGKMEILHFLRAIPVDLRPTLDPQNPPPICQGSARLPERDINQDQRRSAKQETSVVVWPRGKVSLLEVTENLMIVCYSFCSWNICYSLLCMRVVLVSCYDGSIARSSLVAQATVGQSFWMGILHIVKKTQTNK